MPEINIKVRDKCAEGEGVIICNNSDYTVLWDLDEEWTPYDTKTMRVNLADGTYQDVVFTGNSAPLPVLTASGWVSVGLYAGDLHTSRAARLLALSSVLTPGGSPAAPAEDVYAQIMAKLNELSTVSPEDIAKAVEDYLAEHPAASASMRVEGGYIQFSGDGKTWENVIALADLKGPKGDTGAGMDVTGATVDQIAKISAVDDKGVPTAWEPVDMPSGGGGGAELRWIKVASVVTEEETNVLSIGTDFEGREISGYHALGMIVSMTVPADSTQNSTNGSIWTYPSKEQMDADYRTIQSISGWKTKQRSINFGYFGISDALLAAPYTIIGNLIGRTDNVLSGVYLCVQAQGDHLPVGTKVNIAVLSTGWSE